MGLWVLITREVDRLLESGRPIPEFLQDHHRLKLEPERREPEIVGCHQGGQI